jgi:hypothetical protein
MRSTGLAKIARRITLREIYRKTHEIAELKEQVVRIRGDDDVITKDTYVLTADTKVFAYRDSSSSKDKALEGKSKTIPHRTEFFSSIPSLIFPAV